MDLRKRCQDCMLEEEEKEQLIARCKTCLYYLSIGYRERCSWHEASMNNWHVMHTCTNYEEDIEKKIMGKNW